MERFYNKDYWHEGSGRTLWQLRKLQALVAYVSQDDTPLPFLTWATDTEDGTDISSWFAEWHAPGPPSGGIMTAEYSKDGCLTVSAYDPATSGFVFYYDFSDRFLRGERQLDKVDMEPGSTPWSQFPDCVREMKRWLKDHMDNPSKDESYTLLLRQFDLM